MNRRVIPPISKTTRRFANGLVTLYEATFDERWIDRAIAETDVLMGDFLDHEQGGFYWTSKRHETLIARKRDLLRQRHPER